MARLVGPFEPENVLQELSARHDGELSPERAAQLPTQLDEAATAFAEFLDRLDADLAQLPVAAPTTDLTERVRRALPQRAPVWQLRPSTLLAAAAALVCGTWMGLGTNAGAVASGTAVATVSNGSALAAAHDAAFDALSTSYDRSTQ